MAYASFAGARAQRLRTPVDPGAALPEPSGDAADPVHLGLADTPALRAACSQLVNAMYARRGYRTQAATDDHLAWQTTLHAQRGETVVGTLTICMDSDGGIPADALYREQIAGFRRQGSRLCELIRFAVDPSQKSRSLLGRLFHLAYVYGALVSRATHVFIEVHPRHAAFYKRMLNFRQVGAEAMCSRVRAPAVLLYLPVAHAAEQLAAYDEQQARDRRSFYRYLSADRDAGISAAPAGSLAVTPPDPLQFPR
jgi:hypothetical protein